MGVELAATIAIFCASGIVMSFTVEGATVGGAVGVEPAVATVTFCASGMVESFTAEVRATLSIGIAGALLGVGAILGADRTAREMPSAGQASPIFRFGARAALPFGSEFGSESVIQRSPPSALETRRWPFVQSGQNQRKLRAGGEYCKSSQCRPFHPRSSPTKAEANPALAPSGAWRTDRLWFSTGSSCLPRLATVCSSQRISIRPRSIRPRWTANKRPSRRGIWIVSYGSLSSVHPLSHLRRGAAGATACASGSGSFEDITSPIERPRRVSRFVFNEVSVRPHAPMRIHAHGKRTRPHARAGANRLRTSPEIATISTGAQGCFEDVSEDELQQMRRGTPREYSEYPA
jgi:hypothetical protein